MFKERFEFEEYLVKTPGNLLKYLVKFRTRNNRLPIEVGSWNNIELNNRKCELCNKNCIGDEFHYVIECSYFTEYRKRFIKRQSYQYPNVLKFKESMQINPNDNIKFIKLCKFVKCIVKKFSLRNVP